MRKSFKPAVSARDVLANRSDGNNKLLVKAAKAVVAGNSNCIHLEKLQRLESQGQLSRCLDVRCARVWSVVVQSLPEEQMKFSLNAALDVLPHNNNLHRWKKRQDPSCPLCNSNQSLLHVLNNCSVAISLRRYNVLHDKILQEISTVVRAHLAPSASMAVDIGEDYAFPMHIVPTDIQPDLVWW